MRWYRGPRPQIPEVGTIVSVTLDDIRNAATAIAHVIRPTPLIRSHALCKSTGADVFLKPENLQRTGSFKIRGALNRISVLTADERARGVVASSAGNHAQGVALAASSAGIASTIVMPLSAPLMKVERTRNYGAEVVLAGEYYEAAYERALEIQRERDAVFVHPFDDPHVIAGQGTIGLEIIAELPDVDTILVPIGGGGIISGIAIATKALRPSVRIVGVQATGAASAVQSLEVGKLVTLDRADTIADGIRVRQLGELTFRYIQELVDEVVTVDDEEIGRAIVEVIENSKLVVEGAGAVTVAALANGRVRKLGKNVVAMLCGGNADINLLGRVIERGLSHAGRHALVHVRIEDKPGQLREVLDALVVQRVNVLDVEHNRAAWRAPIGSVDVELLTEVRNPEHARAIIDALKANGFDARLRNT